MLEFVNAFFALDKCFFCATEGKEEDLDVLEVKGFCLDPPPRHKFVKRFRLSSARRFLVADRLLFEIRGLGLFSASGRNFSFAPFLNRRYLDRIICFHRTKRAVNYRNEAGQRTTYKSL